MTSKTSDWSQNTELTRLKRSMPGSVAEAAVLGSFCAAASSPLCTSRHGQGISDSNSCIIWGVGGRGRGGLPVANVASAWPQAELCSISLPVLCLIGPLFKMM